jgi:hypothetical protein
MKEIIILLRSENWLNVSETVELAKGKNELPKGFKNSFKKLARQWQLRKT